MDYLEESNPVATLYNDLYGDQESAEKGRLMSIFGRRGRGSTSTLPANVGVPAKQYLTLTHVNRLYDTYQYSVQAATQSKASAAATFRQRSFERALGKALATTLPPHALQLLAEAEEEFLQQGASLVSEIHSLQAQLTQLTIDSDLKKLGIKDPYSLSPAPTADSTSSSNTSTDAATVPSPKADSTWSSSIFTDTATSFAFEKELFRKDEDKMLQQINKYQKELQLLEMKFIRKLLKAVGPTHAASIRTALLGDVTARGSGGLLTSLQERPLTAALRPQSAARPSLYVTRFSGDVLASQVADLREEITAIVRNCKPGDEALLVLQTGGGTVTGYGLAAAQLLRLKDAGLKLTIAVEQVAASGGYMMCCVADHIVASPFAVLGSIGVITDIPNVYERLKREGIEFHTITAGKYKRTLTLTNKATEEDIAKTKEEVEEVMVLFKEFVAQNRPQLNIDEVATGETWFGTDALNRKLCDELKTVDAVIIDYINQGFDVYEVKYSPPPATSSKKLSLFGALSDNDDSSNWVRRSIRWLVQTLASELKRELNLDSNQSVEKRYVAYDDKADRIKVQDR
jgi:serine protease SohB